MVKFSYGINIRPTYKLTANDIDITDLIRQNLVSLSVSDSGGIESDTLDITLSDRGGLAWPSKGAELSFWLGYGDDPAFKGMFYVDELDHSGSPDSITIHAKAMDRLNLGSGLKTRDWSGQSLGQVISQMAAEQELIAAVSESLQSVSRTNFIQLNESDLHFLTRIAREFGAITKIKAGRLLFIERGVSLTAGGNEMPAVSIDRQTCGSHQYQERGANTYGRVSANYYTYYTYSWGYSWWGRRGYTRQVRKLKKVTVGFSGATKSLGGYYESEDAARFAATAELNQLGREESTLSLNLDHGIPSLMAEMRLTVSGFIDRINESDWIISDVSHSLGGSGGLSSSLNAVRPAAYTASS